MTLCPNCKTNQTDAATALCERCDELASKDREIERLREALWDIANLPAGAPTNDSTRLAARLALAEEATPA